MGHLRMKCRKTNTIVRVKHAVQKLQKAALFCLSRWESEYCQFKDKIGDMGVTLRRVKGGYFSVFAMGGGEPKKFFVALSYLAHPPFLKLLEEAEREFGFDQQGVLVIPCQASELQRILS